MNLPPASKFLLTESPKLRAIKLYNVQLQERALNKTVPPA